MSRVVAGLDIGTDTIRAVIGKIDDEQKIEVIGLARKKSKGLRNGVIVNIDAASEVIKHVISEAELEAGEEIEEVFTAIGGNMVSSQNSRGMCGVDTTEKNRCLEITESVKQRAIKAAASVAVPLDRKQIHIIPQEYIIDDVSFKNPIGNLGNRLEVSAHLVSASKTAMATIDECIARSGYVSGGVKLKSLAAASSTVRSDEMELGAVLIDLGAGTTDIMVLNKGAPVYTSSIPMGQELVTNDISVIKNIPFDVAEEMKVNSGCCFSESDGLDEDIVIPAVGGKSPELFSRYELAQIMESRVEEIMKEVIRRVVRESKLVTLGGGIILTGGGALMNGIVDLTQKLWQTSSVRLGSTSAYGYAKDLSYHDPDFATVMGLIALNKNARRPKKTRKSSESGEKEGIIQKIKKLF